VEDVLAEEGIAVPALRVQDVVHQRAEEDEVASRADRDEEIGQR